MQGKQTINLRLFTREEIDSHDNPPTEAIEVVTLDSITFEVYPNIIMTMTDGTQYQGSMNEYTRRKLDSLSDFPECNIEFPYCKLYGFDDDNDHVECAVYLENY